MRKIKFASYIFLLAFYYLFVGYRLYLVLPALIIITTYAFYPYKWRFYLGLEFSIKFFVIFLISLPPCIALCNYIIQHALPTNIILRSQNIKDSLGMVFTFSQCLSEELVFRGLLLSFFVYVRKIHAWKIILINGLLFALFHWVFNLFLFKIKGVIELKALTTLFFFGCSTTIIFLLTKNILLPLLIHFSWNFTRFRSNFVDLNDPQQVIREYASFNLVEGSNNMVILSICFFIVSLILYCLIKKIQK